MFARYGDTRGMDHMRLHPMHTKPARQPEAVATGFEGQCNPRDLAAGLDRLIAPAMQQGKQPFWARLQLLARLTLNAGKHAGNQPARRAHLDHGNDRAILVQGDEGPAQVVRLGHQGTPSVSHSDDGAISSSPAPYHLAARRRRIQTRGFVLRNGSAGACRNECWINELRGAIERRSSDERGDGRSFGGGTGSSNLACSKRESANHLSAPFAWSPFPRSSLRWHRKCRG